MKVHHVKQARVSKKPRKCKTCGHEIQRFEAYKYAEPYTGPKLFWCHKHNPKPSQLTTSKLSAVYEAQEDASEELNKAATVQDVLDILSATAQSARDVAQEYEDSIYAMPDHLQDTSPIAETMNENKDTLEQWADELEELDADDLREENMNDDDFLEAVRSQADELLNGLEI